MSARIVAIGNEILIGQVLDTNSNWLAAALTRLGFDVERIAAIADTPEAIRDALRDAEGAAALVCFTGGLGPTSDDVTKQVIAEYFGAPLVVDSAVLLDILAFFERRGRQQLTAINRSQALVPKGATVLRNPVGTAPGIWIERSGTAFVSMPGVPYEMKQMMTEQVVPRLRTRFELPVIYQRTVLTFGVPESDLATRIAAWEARLADISLAYLPSPAGVRLRLTARGRDREALGRRIAEQIERLRGILPGEIFGFDEDTMGQAVGRLLQARGALMATAESCTGGLIASQLTAQPGASAYYAGSIIAYDNRVKVDQLGVDPALLAQEGAVSGPVVAAMAAGVIARFGVDYSVAVSGIAGPDGGTPEKPVGTVWIAAASRRECRSRRFQFGERRDVNIARSAATALDMLRRLLLESDAGAKQ